MINQVKVMIVLIQFVIFNIFLSGVSCDVNELKLSSTISPIGLESSTKPSEVANFIGDDDYNQSKNSLFNVNDNPKSDVTEQGSIVRFGNSNNGGAVPYQEIDPGFSVNAVPYKPNQNLDYNTKELSQLPPLTSHIVNGQFVTSQPYIEDKPIADYTSSGILGGNLQNQRPNYYPNNNLGQNVYTQPSYPNQIPNYNNPNNIYQQRPIVQDRPILDYRFSGIWGTNLNNRPRVQERPILDYTNNGNFLPNIQIQPPHWQNAQIQPAGGLSATVIARPIVTGTNIQQNVQSRPSFQGTVGQTVHSRPSYYQNGYVYDKPIYPLYPDDTVEIINGYYYGPCKPNPPPTYSTTTETIFPPATARILLEQH